MIRKIDKNSIGEALRAAYDHCKNDAGGKNADYIPYLKNVPSHLFGIAACLPDRAVYLSPVPAGLDPSPRQSNSL